MNEPLTHDDLVNDLAATIDPWKNVVFRGPRLGPWGEGTPVPDLYVFAKSYTRTNIRVFEVKASRSDLLGDVRREKWEKYLPYCDRLYFALGPGIEWKDLLAHQPVGVMVRGPKGWKTVRQGPVNPHRQPIPENIFLAVIFSHLDRLTQKDSRLARLEAEKTHLLKSEIRDLYGCRNRKLQRWADDLLRQELALEAQRKDARRAAFEEIRQALGLETGGFWGDPHERLLRDLLLRPVERVVQRAFKKLEKAATSGADSFLSSHTPGEPLHADPVRPPELGDDKEECG